MALEPDEESDTRSARERDPRLSSYRELEPQGDARAQDERYAKADRAKPEFHSFDSKMVNRAWWTETTEVLEVEFVDTTRYRYQGVGESTWRSFKRARSAGRFVNTVLKKFDYQHV